MPLRTGLALARSSPSAPADRHREQQGARESEPHTRRARHAGRMCGLRVRNEDPRVYGSAMPSTLDELFAAAAGRIRRFTPADALASGAAILDIRAQDARARDGAIPGAYHLPRTVLEWRTASQEWRNPELDGRALILVCDHGYSSVFAAAALVDLGRDAGDVVGGFEAWRAAGLPVTIARAWGGLPGMGPPDE
jgi:rhodanese-related sulfurtransferase